MAQKSASMEASKPWHELADKVGPETAHIQQVSGRLLDAIRPMVATNLVLCQNGDRCPP